MPDSSSPLDVLRRVLNEDVKHSNCFWPTNAKRMPIHGANSAGERASHTERGHTFERAALTQALLVDSEQWPSYIAYAPKHSHMIGILDIDSAKVKQGPKRTEILKVHKEILEAFGDTYIERSQSGASHHILFKLEPDHPFVGKRVNSKLNIEFFISSGYVLLTGDSIAAETLAALGQEEYANLKRFFPAFDHTASGPPVQGAEAIGYDEVVSRMINTGPKWHKLLTGKGEHELDPNQVSEDRVALIQWAATITYGQKDQEQLIWDVLSSSWFATDHTPAVSSNPDRFTNRRKVKQIQNREIPKWVGITNREVQDELEAAERTRQAIEDARVSAPKPPAPDVANHASMMHLRPQRRPYRRIRGDHCKTRPSPRPMWSRPTARPQCRVEARHRKLSAMP